MVDAMSSTDKILVPAEEAAKMLSMGRSTFNDPPPWSRIMVRRATAAEMLGLSEQTFKRHVAQGLLPAGHKITPKSWPVWRVDDLRPFAAGNVPKPVERRPQRVPLGPGVTHLYRHFDSAGRLLYVGISLSAIARLGEHKVSSHWFWQIAKIEVTAYASRASAAKAERITVQREKPLHNIIHARPAA
jgi:predicted DNA-binding transcriptional regulator AlpA